MNIEPIQNYLFQAKINKKEYLFIKDFCQSNQIEIIDFFKKGQQYHTYSIESFFEQAFSKTINDEKMIEYFLSKKEFLPEINFPRLLDWAGMTVKYQHLLGLTKEQELNLLVQKHELSKVLFFLKNNPEFKEKEIIKNLIIDDFESIERFEKAKINFNKESYNQMDCLYNNCLGQKEHNPNFIKVDKFYEFIEKNKTKINKEKRYEYLKSIIGYGGLTVYDFKKQGYWDYVFIPLIHEEEFPELKKERDFFVSLIKYKEQIFSNTEPYGTLKIIENLNSQLKKDLVLNFIKNYEVTEYNSTAYTIFNHFIKEVNENFLEDFFKKGIESGYVFKGSLNEDLQAPYSKKNENIIIEWYSKSLDNDTIRKNHLLIAKLILKYKHFFKENILKNFLPINKEIVENKEFILSLDSDEVNGLVETLKERGLPKTSVRVLEIRLENKLQTKGIVEKKLKI